MSDNIAAFPQWSQHFTGDATACKGGMMLRDYFAAAALQGILDSKYSAPDLRKGEGNELVDKQWSDLCALQAYAFADAMLAAREAT